MCGTKIVEEWIDVWRNDIDYSLCKTVQVRPRIVGGWFLIAGITTGFILTWMKTYPPGIRNREVLRLGGWTQGKDNDSPFPGRSENSEHCHFHRFCRNCEPWWDSFTENQSPLSAPLVSRYRNLTCVRKDEGRRGRTYDNGEGWEWLRVQQLYNAVQWWKSGVALFPQ